MHHNYYFFKVKISSTPQLLYTNINSLISIQSRTKAIRMMKTALKDKDCKDRGCGADALWWSRLQEYRENDAAPSPTSQFLHFIFTYRAKNDLQIKNFTRANYNYDTDTTTKHKTFWKRLFWKAFARLYPASWSARVHAKSAPARGSIRELYTASVQ
jgi:hypothetical protein